MRWTKKKLLGLACVAYGVYMAIDVASSPEKLGAPFRFMSPSTTEAPATPPGPVSDIPTPSNPLNK